MEPGSSIWHILIYIIHLIYYTHLPSPAPAYLISSKYFPISHDGNFSRDIHAEILELFKVLYPPIVDVNKFARCFSTWTVTKERLNNILVLLAWSSFLKKKWNEALIGHASAPGNKSRNICLCHTILWVLNLDGVLLKTVDKLLTLQCVRKSHNDSGNCSQADFM